MPRKRGIRWPASFAALVALQLVIVGLSATPGVAADDSALCHDASGDAAIAACTRAIQSGKLTPANLAAAFNGRGYELLLKKEYDRAISDFSEAIKLSPNYSHAYENRSKAWRAKDDTPARMPTSNGRANKPSFRRYPPTPGVNTAKQPRIYRQLGVRLANVITGPHTGPARPQNARLPVKTIPRHILG